MLHILHISDFHYKSKHNSDYTTIVSLLCDRIKDFAIDLLVFSGDLVYSGESEDDINQAFDVFIKPLMETLHLPIERVLITWGNHDMERGKERKSITNQFGKIEKAEEIEELLSDPRELEDSVENFTQFNSFLAKIYQPTSWEIHSLYIIGKVEINGKKIALVSINSAWRCTESAKDRGNLLFPIYILREIVDKIKDCDIKICNQHHNISDFKGFIEWDYEDLVYDNFDFLFTGHFHKKRIEVNVGADTGLLHSRAYATANRNDKDSYYGFSMLEFDEATYSANVYFYRLTESKLVHITPVELSIPIREEKRDLIQLRKVIRGLSQSARTDADKLFVTGHLTKTDDNYSFSKLFAAPRIADKSQLVQKSSSKTANYLSIEDIINSNDSYLILGSNKSGKTSLLWKIILDIYDAFPNTSAFPFLIDYKIVRNRPDESLEIERKLRDKLQVNRQKLKSFLSQNTLVVLIDNLDENDKVFWNQLVQEIKEFPKVRIIAVADETLNNGLIEIQIDNQNKLKKYFLHDISQKEVKALTAKWPMLNQEKARKVEKKILKLFNQMHIPINYWTTSLFLWIIGKTDEANIHNNFELIKLYIDELLNRKGIVKNRALNVEYDDLLSYLGSLAQFMLQNGADHYSVERRKIEDFADNYISNKKRFTEQRQRTLDYLVKEGVIAIDPSDRFSFRLKGVFEYFLAFRMTEDPTLLNEVLKKEVVLSFGNELELYAGFKKDDIKFVENLFILTKGILEPWTSHPDFDIIDDRLKEEKFDLDKVKRISEKLSQAISQEGADLPDPTIPDTPITDAEVEQKQIYELIELNEPNIEKLVFILSRVYRNSRVCEIQELGNEILNYILTGSCNLGFMLLQDDVINTEDPDIELMVKYISQFMPLMVEGFLFDAICQNNLERVLKEKFDELKANPQGNQFRLFLLGYILIDLDPVKYSCIYKDFPKILKKGILHYAAYAKSMLQLLETGYDKATPELKEWTQNLYEEFHPKLSFHDFINKEEKRGQLKFKQ